MQYTVNTIHSIQSTLYNTQYIQCTIHTIHNTYNTQYIQNTIHIVHSLQYMQYTIYIIKYTIHTMHNTYNTHYMQSTVHSTLGIKARYESEVGNIIAWRIREKATFYAHDDMMCFIQGVLDNVIMIIILSIIIINNYY